MPIPETLRSFALRPGPGQRYLQRAVSGELFIPFADTAWELFHRCTREEALEYLDRRQQQGFNAVFSVLIPELDAKPFNGQTADSGAANGAASIAVDDNVGSRVFYPNRLGEVPFENDDPMTPNEKYFQHVDWVIDEAIKRGITIFLVPTWARWMNTAWSGPPIIFNEENARSYGHYVGKRYPYLPKIMGGDTNPFWIDSLEMKRRIVEAAARKDGSKATIMDMPHIDCHAVINAMAAGVVEAERPRWGQMGKPFLTYHPTALWMPWSPEATGSSFFGDQDWLVLDGCQSGHTDIDNMPVDPPVGHWNARATHVPLEKMWNAKPVRPIIDLESHYEEMYNALRKSTGWQWGPNELRTGAWQSMLSGACGVVYGNNCIWQMYDEEWAKKEPRIIPVCGLDSDASWHRSLDLPGPSQLRILIEFFKSLPPATVYEMQPAQNLLKSSEVPKEKAELDGRIDVSVDIEKTLLLAHSGMGYAFHLDLSAPFGSKRVSMEWLDPRSGKLSRAESESGRFRPPSGGDISHDWVLVVRANS